MQSLWQQNRDSVGQKFCLTAKHIVHPRSSACSFYPSLQTITGNKLINSFSISLGDHKSWKHCYVTQAHVLATTKDAPLGLYRGRELKKRVRFQHRPKRDKAPGEKKKLSPAWGPATQDGHYIFRTAHTLRLTRKATLLSTPSSCCTAHPMCKAPCSSQAR